MTAPDRVPAGFFEAAYRRDPDPWRFATSWYEQRRYDVTMASLPRARYHRAFEPGCSIGALTARLAERCDEVVALDASPSAVEQARARCSGFAHVAISAGEIPVDWPAGTFDLVVLSEVGYYFSPAALADLRQRAVGCLAPGGQLVAVHWRGHSDDHLQAGDDVQRILGGGGDVARLVAHVEDRFRLDVWSR